MAGVAFPRGTKRRPPHLSQENRAWRAALRVRRCLALFATKPSITLRSSLATSSGRSRRPNLHFVFDTCKKVRVPQDRKVRRPFMRPVGRTFICFKLSPQRSRIYAFVRRILTMHRSKIAARASLRVQRQDRAATGHRSQRRSCRGCPFLVELRGIPGARFDRPWLRS